MLKLKTLLVCALVATLVLFGSLLPAGLADNGPNHRVRNLNFGVSGGNVNDISRRFCCSGTLGALLTAGSNQYILSNNHVMGRSGRAVAGEDVSQPGLIDNNCNVSTVVADFTVSAPLGPSNVDASIAQLRPGLMNSNGSIEDIGVPSSTILNASVGLNVAKSGRTTGFTTGQVTATNASVTIQYTASCGGGGKKTNVNFTNQVVISPGTFSAGGDSGSLIVTNNASHNPVALLFAGSSSVTIANPIGEVLTRLSTALGQTLTFGGGGGGSATPAGDQGTPGRKPFTPGVEHLMRTLPQQASDRALAVLENHRASLMVTPGIIGAGIGESGRVDGEAAIIVFVNKNAGQRPFVPESIDGIPVTVVLTDEFVAR